MSRRRHLGTTGLLAAAALVAAAIAVVLSSPGATAGDNSTHDTAGMDDMHGMHGMDHGDHHPVDLRDVVRAVRATAPFHSLDAAKKAGYTVLFQDRLGFTCIEDIATPSQGGMGFHYVNPAYIGATDPAHPAAILYEPGRHGRLHLVALEYLVVEPEQSTAPTVFGQPMMFTPAGDATVNRFMPDAFYSLHAWLWKHNPSGIFAMWNPRVSCPAG